MKTNIIHKEQLFSTITLGNKYFSQGWQGNDCSTFTKQSGELSPSDFKRLDKRMQEQWQKREALEGNIYG